jgi:flavin reductase (DIM6/NTAB) family NADH-FMN oxidoreductase RutF
VKPFIANPSNNTTKDLDAVKSEVPVQEGLRKLPIRPIYLVSCEHEGKKNIISVGMFAYFSGKPTLVGIGIAPSRYSCGLIRKSKAYVVNVVSEKLVDAVRICGEKSGRDLDKFESAKLTATPAIKIASALIEESPLNIECKVVQEVEVGDHIWFIGEVVATHCREGYDWKEGLLLKWVGEEGSYHKVGKTVTRY